MSLWLGRLRALPVLALNKLLLQVLVSELSKGTQQYFSVVLFIIPDTVPESVSEILKCDHSNESFLAVLVP